MTAPGPDELYEKARELYLKRRYSAAKNVLLKGISLFPDHARSHLLLGQIYFHSRKPDLAAAIGEFRQVVRIEPSWAEGHHALGMALSNVGEIELSAVSFRQAIRLAPDDPQPHVSLGICFEQLGKYTEAIEMFRKGLELKPYCTEADVRVFLAEALVKSGQIEEACAEWHKVVEIEEGWPSYGGPQKEARKMLAKYCNQPG